MTIRCPYGKGNFEPEKWSMALKRIEAAYARRGLLELIKPRSHKMEKPRMGLGLSVDAVKQKQIWWEEWK